MIKKHEDKIICGIIVIAVLLWIYGVSNGWW